MREISILDRFLPRSIDNAYRGHKLGLWLFAALAFVKAAMGMNCIFNGYSVASYADGIPLDAFPSGASQTIVAHFALWGLCQFLFGLLGLAALAGAAPSTTRKKRGARGRSRISICLRKLIGALSGGAILHVRGKRAGRTPGSSRAASSGRWCRAGRSATPTT